MKAGAMEIEKTGRASWTRRWGYELDSEDWGPGRKIAIEVENPHTVHGLGGSEFPSKVESIVEIKKV